MTVADKTHGRDAGAARTWCGRPLSRFPYPVLAADGQDPECGNCVRLATRPGRFPGSRCPGCGYVRPKCDCEQRELIEKAGMS